MKKKWVTTNCGITRFLAGLALVILGFANTASASAGTMAIATQGYIYGFPLVLMGETLERLTGETRSCEISTEINTFFHVMELPDADYKIVVRPNLDTLYSFAMLELSEGPVLLTHPDVTDRYLLMTFLDAWSNNFDAIGTQRNGGKAAGYVIVGPDWSGNVPMDYVRIDSPTNLVWVLGRTEVRGTDDIAAVNALQEQYQLTPYGRHPQPGNDFITCIPEAQRKSSIEVVKSLSGEAFFDRLSALMTLYPPPRQDAAMVRLLARIGVGPDAERSMAELPACTRRLINSGAILGRSILRNSTSVLGLAGWGPNPALIPLGDYGKNYLVRAVVAQIGFGANKGEYAVYQNAERDANLKPLSGKAVYTMTFSGDDLPPVKAFWSVTVYDDEGFLCKNSAAEQLLGISRHALGSNSGLASDADGNITLYLGREPPAGIPLENWLPTPDGSFQVTIRLYQPDDRILSNRWKAPKLVRRKNL